MNTIYRKILLNRERKQKMIAVLLDPDKCKGRVLSATVSALLSNQPDFIFVGGSHTLMPTESFIELLKEETKSDVILFPGDASQFSGNAHAMLYLSLVSGRNPEFLIGQHITSSVAIKNSDVEVISTGYVLIDGGKPSSVEYISNTKPIPSDKKEIALSTAVAAELLGMKLVYLEAGSGATNPVPAELIEYVSCGLSLPLIVGGGIRTTEDLTAAYEAGADIVVIGNVLEHDPFKVSELVECARNFGIGNEDEYFETYG
jgi:putative glycerol-1-phosphate prenyltransferase